MSPSTVVTVLTKPINLLYPIGHFINIDGLRAAKVMY